MSKQSAHVKRVDAEVLLSVLAQARAGDFAARMPLHWTGVAGKVADSLNEVLASNQALGAELERVSRVVGKEGRLSQRVSFHGTDQVWAGCLESVNSLIEDLVRPSNEMQRVIGAVADGDLSKKVSADVQGEMLELKNTINGMVDQLNGFVSEVTRVAREVGTEGKLGQAAAYTIEVGGVWKDLTDNVNLMAGNLTGQVRDIAEVTTAVANGDLSKKITADVRGEFLELKNTVNAMVDQLNRFAGEVAVLKDKLNMMIGNLRDTMRQNTERDWLKTNLERFTRMLQGQRDLATVSKMILSELTPLVAAQHGVFYVLTDRDDGLGPVLTLQASYGFKERKHLASAFRLGEGLVGQCAVEKERILLTDVPRDYVQINSGLGESAPINIIVLPILFEGSVRAVIELASFAPFSATHQSLLDQLAGNIGLVLNTVDAASVTDRLLEQAQSQAHELQSRQEQLSQSNGDLAAQATLLAEKNDEVERRFQEVEAAKRLVENSANELALSSRYKSEFIANMSHELRTPLNSLLVLAEQLEDNPDGNLTESQVKYASVIRSSGGDLLQLLNDILDLAKVESNTVRLEMGELALADLADSMLHNFGPIAAQQGVAFAVAIDEALPAAMVTDSLRLRQVLKNLLANALKFTEHGTVTLRLAPAHGGWSPDAQRLADADAVIAISVVDTGIGIARDLHSTIFEAFAQADGATARRYGGTGLGLAISRDLVGLLGGEITLTSVVGAGSTFTVLLPLDARAATAVADVPAAVAVAPVTSPAPRGGAGSSYNGVFDGATVLIVDDDFRNIFALTALLERGGLTVLAAQSGPAALAILDEQSEVIDLVLMDIMMPVMNGYETMTAMRARPGLANLPIIAVTGKVVGGERERCNAAGASDYIPKPVDTAELLVALTRWFPAAVAGDTAETVA
jgi:signal transduction histidine kinase/HAMP domain-containing protein/ActR/RegA family two-component response regulator